MRPVALTRFVDGVERRVEGVPGAWDALDPRRRVGNYVPQPGPGVVSPWL
jgi:hypothetical protein